MVKRSGGRVVRKTPRRRAMRLPEDVDMVAMPLTGVRVVLHQIKRALVGGGAVGALREERRRDMSLELEYHHAREIWRAMYRSLRGLVRIRADVQAIQHQRSWLKFWTRERLWLESRKEAHRVAQVQSESEGGRGGRSGVRRGDHRSALQSGERVHRQVGGGCVAAGELRAAGSGKHRGKPAGGAGRAAGVHRAAKGR